MELPTDLMFNIFLRLECRDIVRCMGVCRAWRNFISDPNFSTDYARYSSFSTFLVSQRDDYASYLFLIHFTADGDFIRRSIKPKVMRTSKGNLIVSIFGSCNGLLFFSLRKHNNATEKVYFGNPVLGTYAALGVSKRVNKHLHYEESHLGFVPSTNKIKLLRIGLDKYGRIEEAYILTFKEDNNWRKLKYSSAPWISRPTGTSFNGVYHWVGKNVDWICTFDFGKEKSGQMSKPSGMLHPPGLRHPPCERMTVLNNHLCLIEHKYGVGMIIWTMKEYGAAESWSKDFQLLESHFHYIYIWNVFPLALLPNGDILLASRGQKYDLLIYRPKANKRSSVRLIDARPKMYTPHASAFAPRFYALEEDVGQNGSCYCVP